MNRLESFFTKSEKIAWRVVEEDSVLLNLDTGYYYTLNEVGRFLWESLDGKKELSAIHKEILDHYDVDPETAKSDILELIDNLLKEGLVEIHESPEEGLSSPAAP
ncbi:MAG: PqqD family protein [Proteobacteria bacterium]|nr:PqqD family protein [Pseudomonadota bacterium]